MSSLKRIDINDLQLGMIIVKCDRAGVPFNEYGKPLSNLKYIDYLCGYGVDSVYILTDETTINTTSSTEDSEIKTSTVKEFDISAEDDINAVEVSQATELVQNLKNQFTSSMKELSDGKPLNIQIMSTLIRDVISVSGTNPGVLAKILMDEGVSHDDYNHSINVCVNAISLGRAIGLNQNELYNLGIASILHDIGKVRIPKNILNKKTTLSPHELAIMKKHPEFAEQVLRNYNSISDNIISIILQHHEYCDGSGYPSGLTAKYISKSAQVLAISEAYNSMISFSNEFPRAFNKTDALKQLYMESGKKFSHDIMKTFIKIIGVYPVGTAVALSDHSIGIVCEINQADQSKPKVLVIDKHDHSKIKLLNLKNIKNLYVVKAITNIESDIVPNEIFQAFIKNRMEAQV